MGNREEFREISGLLFCILFDTAWQMRFVFLCGIGICPYPSAHVIEKPDFSQRVELAVIFCHTFCGKAEAVL